MKMEFINSHTVTKNSNDLRLVDYLLQLETSFWQEPPSRNYIRKLIKAGCITIDSKPAITAAIPKPDQMIDVFEPDITPVKIYNLKFPVVYEDDYLAVINKPAGIIVSGNRFRTIENSLLNNLQRSNQKDALNLPRPVHRLDAATSGLLIIAKTRQVRRILGEMFSKKEIEKTYKAIVIGKTPESGTIELPIDGQSAITEFRSLRSIPSLKSKWLTLLQLKPGTGRTHQLRIHLSESGFPILGDKLYGKEEYLFKGKGLFLSAVGLNFHHPVSDDVIDLTIDEPSKFKIHLDREERRWNKFNKKT